MAYQSQNNNNRDQDYRSNHSDDFLADALIGGIASYGSQLASLKTQIEESSKNIEALERKIAKLNKQNKQSMNKIKAANDDIKNIRDKTIEPLAVFVGLFTFASLTFGTLTHDIGPNDWISLVVIASGMMLVFPCLVLLASDISSDKKSRMIFIVILLTLGVLLVVFGIIMHSV